MQDESTFALFDPGTALQSIPRCPEGEIVTDANVAKEREEEQLQEATPEKDDEPFDDASHLEEVPDGSGCTEIWEHLSERREKEREKS